VPEANGDTTVVPEAGFRERDYRWLSRLLAAASCVAATMVCFILAVHVDDRYDIDHASGARIALARYASEGVLYPPLAEHGHFGGTRFMPLPIMLHAAASKVTGEFVISGKLLSILTVIAVLAVVHRVVRREGCPRSLSAGLVASVAATQTGLLALAGLRGDSLPLLFQLLSVALVCYSRTKAATWASAAFGSLAVLAKVHAVWAPAAIAVWLYARDRPRLKPFLVVYFSSTIVMVGALIVLTDGRFSDNVLGLSTAGVTGSQWVHSPYRLTLLLVAEATGTWFLLPIALVIIALAMRRRSPDPWQLSLLGALGVLLVVLSDIGTGGNQLLDVTVLTVIVIGVAAGRQVRSTTSNTPRVAFLSVMVCWVLVTGMVVTLGPAFREAVATVKDPGRYRTEPLAGIADHKTAILSEDPFLPVSLGQDPVVLDPFMLLRTAAGHPHAINQLIHRIERHEFDLVALIEPLDDREWWANYHFGTRVIEAIDRSYAFSQRVQGYDLYRPRSGE
jgi:hypothetical protein